MAEGTAREVVLKHLGRAALILAGVMHIITSHDNFDAHLGEGIFWLVLGFAFIWWGTKGIDHD